MEAKEELLLSSNSGLEPERQYVLRNLDGLVFQAVVLRRNGDNTLDIEYLDDGNKEYDVPEDEVTPVVGNGPRCPGPKGDSSIAATCDEPQPSVLVHDAEHDKGA